MDTNELSEKALSHALCMRNAERSLNEAVKLCGGLPDAYERYKNRPLCEVMDTLAPNGVRFVFIESLTIENFKSTAAAVVDAKKYL